MHKETACPVPVILLPSAERCIRARGKPLLAVVDYQRTLLKLQIYKITVVWLDG